LRYEIIVAISAITKMSFLRKASNVMTTYLRNELHFKITFRTYATSIARVWLIFEKQDYI